MFAIQHCIAECSTFAIRLCKATCAGAISASILTGLAGCNNDDSSAVPRVSVSGTVTLDGQPLRAGAIVFHSDATTADRVPLTSFSFIENGSYRIEMDAGPTIGSARVEFRSKPLERGEMEDALDEATASSRRRVPKTTVVAIPDKYGERSTLTVELTEGENQHDFHLDSRR